MKQKSGPESRRRTRSGTFGARHVDTFQLKRKSASSWKSCGGRRAYLSPYFAPTPRRWWPNLSKPGGGMSGMDY
jgi:hypothetical protein